MQRGWDAVIEYLCHLLSKIDASTITAFATIALAWLTFELAKATKAMAGKANVVASIDRNQWAIHLQDLVVHNAGNAPAFDVKISFDQPLPTSFPREDGTPPLNKISILRPGQVITSSISEAEKLQGTYRVTISWKSRPTSWRKQKISYDINLQELGPVSQWGSSTPLVEMAKTLNKIRSDVVNIARGRRIKVDSYGHRDREREKEDLQKRKAEWEQRQKKGSASTDQE